MASTRKRKAATAKRGKSTKPTRPRSESRQAGKPPRAAAPPPAPPGVITIRKYSNRRLYDTASSAHITQEDLYRMVGRGSVVRVIDASTEEDITNQTLALALIEHDPGKLRLMPAWLVHQMIRLHEQALGGWLGPLWQMPAAGGGGGWPGFGAAWPVSGAMAGWNPFLQSQRAEPGAAPSPQAQPSDHAQSIAQVRRELDRLTRRLGELEEEGRTGWRE